MKKYILVLSLMSAFGTCMTQAQTVYTYIKQDGSYVEADGVCKSDLSLTEDKAVSDKIVSLSYDGTDAIMKITGNTNAVARLTGMDMADGGVLAADFTHDGNGVTRYKDDTQYLYATIYSPFQVVVPNTPGISVYAAEYDISERKILLNGKRLDAGKIVPIGRCLVMKRSASARDTSFDFTFSTGTPNVETEGYLEGTAVNKPTPTDPTGRVVYVEGVGNISGNEGFFKYTGSYIDAGKMYVLADPASGAKSSYIAFDDEDDTTTGIKAVSGEELGVYSTVYNAMGQRVNAATKGMIIINNKKYLNK